MEIYTNETGNPSNIQCDENHNYFEDGYYEDCPLHLPCNGEHHGLVLASNEANSTEKINHFVVQEEARRTSRHAEAAQKDNRCTSDEKEISEEYESSDDEVPLASLLKGGKLNVTRMYWEDVLPMHRCNHCSYASKKRYLLFRHLKVHGEDNQSRKRNWRDSKRNDDVQGHEKSDLNLSNEKPSATTYHDEDEILPVVTYTCNNCCYKTSKRYLLTRHSRIHTGDRPYKCEICDRRFTLASALKAHVNVHNGVKKYKCNHCERSFTTQGEMKRHVKYKHTFLKPHKCMECNYSAVERCKIVRHMRCHTNNNRVKITPSQHDSDVDLNYVYKPDRSAITITYSTYIPSP